MIKLGLVGKTLKHSFSKEYFSNKFKINNIEASYTNFEMEDISEIRKLFFKHHLKGVNITIPYKESVIPFLDEISDDARKIGAVNTVNLENGKLIGYNTDYIGFASSIKPHLHQKHERALILGTGGASKSVTHVLDNLGINYLFASTSKKDTNIFTYNQINDYLLKFHLFVINTTPIGTFPAVDEKPPIDYNGITENHFLYDLVYNPSETAFIKEGKAKGAMVMNGYDMLKIQAEEAFKIWIK